MVGVQRLAEVIPRPFSRLLAVPDYPQTTLTPSMFCKGQGHSGPPRHHPARLGKPSAHIALIFPHGRNPKDVPPEGRGDEGKVVLFLFKFILRERVHASREGAERGGESEFQAGSVLSAWSPKRGSISQILRS